MTTPTHYKGIPLEHWVSECLLALLSDEEMIELHSLMYSRIIDEVEPFVKRSKMVESDLVIQHIKSKL